MYANVHGKRERQKKREREMEGESEWAKWRERHLRSWDPWDFFGISWSFESMLIWDDPDYSVMSEPICHAWRHDEYKYLEHISSIAQGIEQGVCILCSCITKAMKFLTMQLTLSGRGYTTVYPRENFWKFRFFSQKTQKFDHVFNRNDKYYSLVSINPVS